MHFVGIGGIGMSGIAEVFLNQGYRVSGSDLADTDTTRRLEGLGAGINRNHAAANVTGASVVVVSSAIRPDNPELLEARRRRIPVIRRAEMLGELMRGKTGVAVAGTHGKTTTTSMLATVLSSAELDPTMVVGGKVDSLGGNAKLGHGEYVVAEADESDGSFLHLPAMYGIITNIDNDHLDHFGSLLAVEDAFVDFVAKLPFYGFAAVCADDPGVRRCLSRFTKPVVTYGFAPDCNFCAMDVVNDKTCTEFSVQLHGRRLGRIRINVPGRHNVLNALAVVAICNGLGLPFEKISAGLAAYSGVRRRFDIRYKNDITRRAVIDDYGHHPTEIAVTLDAARDYWPGRIIAVFQPHRYSRTLHCHDGFLTAFKNCDLLFVCDVYSAGEEPIEGVTAQNLATDIRAAACSCNTNINYSGSLEETLSAVIKIMKDGDLVLCLGAGSITRLPQNLVQALEDRA